MKRCPACTVNKAESEFGKNSRRNDGLQDYCRFCQRAKSRESYARHAERERKRVAAYSRRHPEVNRKAARKYQLANPEKHCDGEATRRARKLAAFVEHVDRTVVWERDNGICHICHTTADPLNWHLEHIIPLSRGGEHSYANTAVSHPACNLAKGARLP